jgi:hypothetical protein
MDNTELIQLWKAQDAKLERALALNQLLLRETINQKAKSTLRPLLKFKTAGIIAFVFYLWFLGYGLYYGVANYSSAWNYFIVSVSAIMLINLKGFFDYIRHLYWTHHINYDGSVVEIQQQLSRLQLSIIDHSRTMCLQFPFFTTFYLSDTWFPSEVGWPYLFFQIIKTGAFIGLSYWLYKNHKPENLEKRWFRVMIDGSGGKSIAKAMAIYKEAERFKEED